MQEKLHEKYPVYLLLPGIDNLTGFMEFFGELGDKKREEKYSFYWKNEISKNEL